MIQGLKGQKAVVLARKDFSTWNSRIISYYFIKRKEKEDEKEDEKNPCAAVDSQYEHGLFSGSSWSC
jgi:hypothetical protein